MNIALPDITRSNNPLRAGNDTTRPDIALRAQNPPVRQGILRAGPRSVPATHWKHPIKSTGVSWAERARTLAPTSNPHSALGAT